MIKTVSFAPQRAAHSRSSAVSSKATPASNPVLAFDSPRVTNESAASGSPIASPRIKKASVKVRSETSLDLFGAPDESIPDLVAAPVASPIAIPTEAPSIQPKSKVTKKVAAKPADASDSTKNEAKAEEKSLAAPIAVKAKKARVPKDLAAQYGEKTVIRPATVQLETESTKKRLSKTERQARRDLMKPSEGLMERLARANQISLRKPAAEPRGKGWKFACGRCGATSYFQTPGGLCVCGTIAVKE